MPRGVPKAGFRMTKNRKMGKGKFAKSSRGSSVSVSAPIYREPEIVETEDQIRNKLDERFAAMTMMVESAFNGDVRAVIFSGPPGVGKSHEVMAALEKHKPYHTVIHGFVRPTGLYKTLYEYRAPGSVVVLDDADSIFVDEICLDLLKTACDTTRKRVISWLSETNMKDEGGDGLPTQFEFEGTVIFITNTDFDWLIEKGNKLAPHLSALVSRSMYLDMAMKSKRDYLVRIKQVVEKGMLRDLKMSKVDENEILAFIDKYQDTLRELSLRMVVKIANLKRARPSKWQSLAKVFCVKGSN
jgi:hypothetical protein